MRYATSLKTTLLVSLPLALIVAGCGGSSGGLVPSPTPTLTPIPFLTSTPIPPTPPITRFTLSNGQRVGLRFLTTENRVGVTFYVFTAGAQTRALSRPIPVSIYDLLGTFTPPRAYDVTGGLDGQRTIRMTGQIPTEQASGSYSITIDGETENGVIPPLGTTTD